jgi:hypothetical protein
VWYQNVQLEELNPIMYHTWGWGVGNPLTTKRLALPLEERLEIFIITIAVSEEFLLFVILKEKKPHKVRYMTQLGERRIT